MSSECPRYSKSWSLFYSDQASLSPLSVLGMIHKALCIVWVMVFQQLFCPGICSLLEFMEFQPVDTQILSPTLKRCFTDVQSSPSAYLPFPKLFPEMSRWVCLPELFCVSAAQQNCLALSFDCWAVFSSFLAL